MKRALVTVVLLAIGNAGFAWAQPVRQPDAEKYLRVPHRWQVYVELAGALPTSPGVFNDYWNSAFQFGAGAGVSVFPWLEVNGNFAYVSWSNNSTRSKGKIGYVGVNDVEEGTIKTMTISGSARFLAVPSSRTNPYAEVAIGWYSTSGDDLVIEGVLTNTMESASGITVAPSIGIQHALNEVWSAYARYTYILNLGDTFAPGELLQPEGGGEPLEGENQVYQSIGVGIVLRI
jgi:hypothetical protein